MEILGVHRSATAFEGAAAVYEQARPGYPAAARRWLAETLDLGPTRTVLDLAAGTGKFTRELIATGAMVVAVEPVPAMRKTLADTTRRPDGSPVPVVAAVAQALPVGDGLFDAVTVAQGFHWFATRATVAEIHRVVRPGGGLGLIWNRRDQADPLQAALTELMEPVRGDTPAYDTGTWRRALEPDDRFRAVDETHVPWRQAVDVDAVADRVASVSFVAAMAGDDRHRLLRRVRAVAADGGAPISLAYVTDVFAFGRVD